jgi:hypothetical protein
VPAGGTLLRLSSSSSGVKSSECTTIGRSHGHVRNGKWKKDPRWQLGCRQHELHDSKILLRCWSHTWRKWSTKENQNFYTLACKNFSMACCTERTDELLPLPPAPNLHMRHLADQTSEPQASCSISPATTGINQPRPLGYQIRQQWKNRGTKRFKT